MKLIDVAPTLSGIMQIDLTDAEGVNIFSNLGE